MPQKVFERGFIHVMAYAANTNFATYSSHFIFSIFSRQNHESWETSKKYESWVDDSSMMRIERKSKLVKIRFGQVKS